ncbi:MAG: DegT/DnrJ/EryC1/StrS family aminotransferase [Burkholderiaceae bacterium]
MLDHPTFKPWPQFAPDEIEAVSGVLASGKVNYWTGEIAREFERDYASYTNRKHAIALANGTVALELALMAFGVGEGAEVIVPSRTYVASASCAVMRGATPVVADVCKESQALTVETIEAALTPRTKAIIVVHLAGWPADMNSIMQLARRHDLIVIEDCAQAHGALYKGQPVGAFGHAAAFSFCQDKIITTGGEGGMLLLDDEDAWKRAWTYKDIGRSFDAVYHRTHPPGFRWLTEDFGTNWRMTEMQAAIGRIQLKKLPQWVARRRANAKTLVDNFVKVKGLRVPVPPDDIDHAFYKFYAFVEPEQLKHGWDRDRIMEEVNANGIPCSVGSCSEIYLEKAFKDRGWGPKTRLPIAKELGETSLMFMVHPTLSRENIDATWAVLQKVMSTACR